MFGSAVAAPMVGIGYGVLENYVSSQQPKPGDSGRTRPVMGDWVIRPPRPSKQEINESPSATKLCAETGVTGSTGWSSS